MKKIIFLMISMLLFSLTGCVDDNVTHREGLSESQFSTQTDSVHETETQQQTVIDDSYSSETATDEFVYAKPAAEWDEMPLHKCIYCKGTARLVSGAWCCEACEAVYGEEDFVEKVSFDDFKEGKWQDTYSKLCSLTLDVIDKETVSIEIKWLRSDGENMQWNITGKWDSYWGMLRYEDGNGFFYMDEGYLYWVDYKDSAGYHCVFEYCAS